MNKITNTKKMKEIRIKKGYTCEDMSKALRLKTTTEYYNIENGNKEPTISIAKEIAQVLGVSTSTVFNI